MSRGDVVVLLHGLGRTNLSLWLAHAVLRRAGYRCVSIHYPSRSRTIEELAGYVRERLPERREGRVHFLTHSMGGLVTRYLLRFDRPENLGRVVMLAPPNQGSQLAERLVKKGLFEKVLGPAAKQLGSGSQCLSELLGTIDFELGVITGDRPRGSLLSRLIRGRSDGKVAVDEARVEGMADFLVVHRGHTFIMNDLKVIRQAAHFFECGSFEHS